MPVAHGAHMPLSPGYPTSGVQIHQKEVHHHRGKTRSACQATASDIPLPAHAMPLEQGALVPLTPGWPAFYPNHGRQGVCKCQDTALDNWGVSPQRQDTGRMSSYRFRYTPASPCNATGTRSACPTATRVASISPTKGQHKRGTCRNCNSIMAETKYKR